MATLESKRIGTSCSSTFNHPMSTNNQLTMTTCRGNNISVDDTHAAVNYSHSPPYIGSSPSCLINSNSINQVATDCIRTGALEIVRSLAINNGGVCKLASVKKIAVSAAVDKNANNIAKNDHECNDHDNGCTSARMISSVAPYCVRENNHVRKISAAGESNKNKTTARDCHGYDYNYDVVRPMIFTSAVINTDTNVVHETSHTKSKPSALAKANANFEKYEHDQCSIAADSRRRSQRICMLQSPASSLDVQKSLCDQLKSNNVHNAGVLHGWLQAMRETSPPRTTSPTYTTSVPSSSANSFDSTMPACTSSQYNHSNTESSENLQAMIHRAWMAKHPSALEKLEEIVEAASGKRVAVFLDYDGTLSPIVEDPDRAFMSHQMRAIVKEVANVFPTAIISGRCKEKLHEFVQLPELYYAGSHGMDIIGPARPYGSYDARSPNDKGKEATVLFQPAKEFTLLIDKVFKDLEEKIKGVPGAKVEHNKFCVSVHFRCVKERHWVALAEQVHEVLRSYANIRLTPGRKVLEIRPLIAWNKGKALEFLLKTLGLGDQNTTFPIYLGDDRSDEDAFKVLNRKRHGLGILVTAVAKETNAVCSLRDPSEVGELLKRLVKWKRRRLDKFL